VSLISGVPNIDRKDRRDQILSQLDMLLWVFSRNWANIKLMLDAPLKNLVKSWLGFVIEKSDEVVIHQVVRCCQPDRLILRFLKTLLNL
jgi:hypothetical protein